MAVYDALGRQVATLVNAHQGTGYSAVSFAASGLPNSVFFVRLRANERTAVHRITVLR